MPYPAGHRATVKKNIIDSARKLFNRYGFESVSLNQIMAGAGLTHGGFYSYFKSKSDLYAAVLGCFFTRPGVEKLLGRCACGSVIDRRRTASRPRLSISPAFRRRRELLPNGRIADRRRAQRRKCEARLRDRVQSHGKRLGAELDSEWQTSPHHGTEHSCLGHRRHGRGSYHGRPRSCGRFASGLYGCRPQSWRLGQKEQIGERQIQAIPTAPGGNVLVAPDAQQRTADACFTLSPW